MSGRLAFDGLTEAFAPERRACVDARKAELRADMPRHELRQARAMARKAVGDVLKLEPAGLARLEQHMDVYVSSLRSHVESMGGRLNIVAEFPQGSVAVAGFSEVGEEPGFDR